MKRKIYVIASERVFLGMDSGARLRLDDMPLCFPGIYEVMLDVEMEGLSDDKMVRTPGTIGYGHQKVVYVTELEYAMQRLMRPSILQVSFHRDLARSTGHSLWPFGIYTTLEGAKKAFFDVIDAEMQLSSSGDLQQRLRMVAPMFTIGGDMQELSELASEFGGDLEKDAVNTGALLGALYDRGFGARIVSARFTSWEVVVKRREVCRTIYEAARRGVAAYAHTLPDMMKIDRGFMSDYRSVAEAIEGRRSSFNGWFVWYEGVEHPPEDMDRGGYGLRHDSEGFSRWVTSGLDETLEGTKKTYGIERSLRLEWEKSRSIDWHRVVRAFGLTKGAFLEGEPLRCQPYLRPVWPRSWQPYDEEALAGLLEEDPERTVRYVRGARERWTGPFENGGEP